MAVRKQFCFECGEPLGEFDAWGERYLTCGKRECEREARHAMQAERDEAAERAREDDYDRYRY